MKTILKVFVLALMFVIYSFSVQAAEVKYDLTEVQAIAKNAPGYLLGDVWTGTKVVKSTPVYDFAGKLIAYNVDLVNGNKKAYAIISTSLDDGPILQFAEGKSPYDGLRETAVYGGVGRYFSLNDNKYRDIVNNKELGAEEVRSRKEVDKARKGISKSPDVAKNTRAELSKDEAPGAVTTSMVTTASVPPIVFRNLVDYAPDWTWYLGCSPTAAGEVIKNNFHNNSAISATSKSTLVSRLATNMHTDANGNTLMAYLEQGIIDTLATYGISGYAYYGDTSPFQLLIDNIQVDRAMIVSVNDNTTYGDHSMCAMGFAQGTTGTHYIVLHTNNSLFNVEGDVYCDYESDSFNSPYSEPVLTAIY